MACKFCRTRYLDASAIVEGEEIYAPQEDYKEKNKESDFVVFLPAVEDFR